VGPDGDHGSGTTQSFTQLPRFFHVESLLKEGLSDED
jgi:hypothetical protein